MKTAHQLTMPVSDTMAVNEGCIPKRLLSGLRPLLQDLVSLHWTCQKAFVALCKDGKHLWPSLHPLLSGMKVMVSPNAIAREYRFSSSANVTTYFQVGNKQMGRLRRTCDLLPCRYLMLQSLGSFRLPWDLDPCCHDVVSYQDRK